MTEEEFAKERLSAKVGPGDVSEERKEKRRLTKKALQSRVPLGPDGMPITDKVIDIDSGSSSMPYYDPWGPLPDYKNWFEEGYVTHPYDQGSCGSCWAFSTASTLESLAMITQTEPTGKLQEYSV